MNMDTIEVEAVARVAKAPNIPTLSELASLRLIAEGGGCGELVLE